MTGAPYAPFMEARTARPPGLSPLEMNQWLVRDPDFAAQMVERDALILSGAPDVIAEPAAAAAAVAELLEALLAHLARRGGWVVTHDAVRRPDGVSVARQGAALAQAGRWAQEDFLLLLPDEDVHRLVAGVLCFPSRWSLGEKLGRPLAAIHGPVPHYAEHLAARVDRVFAALAPQRPLMRVNWLATGASALRQAVREGEARPPMREGHWLRTERQTLVRLPRTRAVVFAIKTTLTPFADLTAAQRGGLRAALSAWSDEEVAYRGGRSFHDGALAALA